MYTLKWLVTESNHTQTEVKSNGKWVSARPLTGCLKWRLQDAWKVFTGKADAFTWPEGQ